MEPAQKKEVVAVNKDERSCRSDECFEVRYVSAKYGVFSAVFWFCFGPFLAVTFWNVNVYPVMLKICDLLFKFYFVGDYC